MFKNIFLASRFVLSINKVNCNYKYIHIGLKEVHRFSSNVYKIWNIYYQCYWNRKLIKYIIYTYIMYLCMRMRYINDCNKFPRDFRGMSHSKTHNFAETIHVFRGISPSFEWIYFQVQHVIRFLENLAFLARRYVRRNQSYRSYLFLDRMIKRWSRINPFSTYVYKSEIFDVITLLYNDLWIFHDECSIYKLLINKSFRFFIWVFRMKINIEIKGIFNQYIKGIGTKR